MHWFAFYLNLNWFPQICENYVILGLFYKEKNQMLVYELKGKIIFKNPFWHTVPFLLANFRNAYYDIILTTVHVNLYIFF